MKKSTKCRNFVASIMDLDELINPTKGVCLLNMAIIKLDVDTMELLSRRPWFYGKAQRKGKNRMTPLHNIAGISSRQRSSIEEERNHGKSPEENRKY